MDRLKQIFPGTWASLRMYAAVAAIAAVGIAILLTDLANGGADEIVPQNSAPIEAPNLSTRPPGTPRPTAEATVTAPTEEGTVVSPEDAKARDFRRKVELGQLVVALEEYRAAEGEYPSTGGNTQTGCNYAELDALCKIKDYLDPIPSDPRGDPGSNGYWYISDGKTYTVVAEMEIAENATPPTCPDELIELLDRENLFCLSGGSQ